MAGFLKHAGLLAGVILPVLAAPAPTVQQASVVPGKYLVKVRPESDIESHASWVADIHARSVNRRQTAGIEKTFGFGSFQAYSGEFDESTIAEIEANEDVLLVESDIYFNPLDELVIQSTAEYNLALLSSLEAFTSREPVHDYIYDSSGGTGQFAYVVDTGVFVEHNDFDGRAFKGYNARPELPFEDGYGHGTHCAGTIGSTTYGVAKNVTIFDVKVLDNNGAGTIENMLDGYNWAVNNATAAGRVEKSLVSMSLGWPTSQIINDAVQAAYELGFLTVVSAGNNNADASTKSPASAANAVTVGATDFNRTRAYYSNFGLGIDIWAPGNDVRSLANVQDETRLLSGTSMATPLTAGLVAYLRTLENLPSAEESIARLKELALKDVVNDPRGSPNQFVHNSAT